MIGQTDTGQVRENNEDSFFIDQESLFGVVCDGVGGNAGGEVASKLAIEQMKLEFRDQKTINMDPTSFIKKSVLEANTKICEQARQDPDLNSMATTLNCVYIKDKEVFVGNVGDSRTYLFCEDHLWQITIDHNIESLIKYGDLSAEYENTPGFKAKALGYYLGKSNLERVDVYSLPLVNNQIFITSSDGLFDMVSPQEIWTVVRQNINDIKTMCSTLIDRANNNGGKDNITVIITKISE